jgi:hypothetical protein
VHWKEDPAYLEQLKGELERAVDKIAERKYKGFNQSISSFTAILKQFTAAQNTFARLQQQVPLTGDCDCCELASSTTHSMRLSVVLSLNFRHSIPSFYLFIYLSLYLSISLSVDLSPLPGRRHAAPAGRRRAAAKPALDAL